MGKLILEIDGTRFSDLEDFWDEVSTRLVPGASWGRNLDAFNDILRGGFGTPETGFVLRWVNAARSRDALGYLETARYLRAKLQKCHSTARSSVACELHAAEANQGLTLFDILVEIIRDHGPGGQQADDGVELELA